VKQKNVKTATPVKTGRRTKYVPEMNLIAKELGADGLTDKEIAKLFGVTEQTLNNWKRKFPMFFVSLKAGKAQADDKVEAALYQRAVGYSAPDVHISNHQGSVTMTPIIKHYPPDTTAQIFWLKNRKPDKWRDRQDQNLDVTGNLAELVQAAVENIKKNGISPIAAAILAKEKHK